MLKKETPSALSGGEEEVEEEKKRGRKRKKKAKDKNKVWEFEDNFFLIKMEDSVF